MCLDGCAADCVDDGVDAIAMREGVSGLAELLIRWQTIRKGTSLERVTAVLFRG